MIISEFKRNPQENEIQTLWRIGKLKDDEVLEASWIEIADFMNKEFRADETEFRTEAAYRKQFANGRLFFEQVFSSSEKADTLSDGVQEKIIEMKKERVKLRDERTEYNRIIREQARLDQKLDRLSDSLKEIGCRWFFVANDHNKEKNENCEMIVILSDLHIGSEFCSVNGIYRPEIALERIAKYTDRVKEIQKQSSASVCNLMVLGDLIEGGMRVTQRVESSDNVIEQVKMASMLVSNFITQMASAFETVRVRYVTGNHSRITVHKEESTRDERLDDLVIWCSQNMLAHLKNIEFIEPMDATYDRAWICDKEYVLVHGDFDTYNNAGIGKLCFMTGSIPYCVVSGHKHFPELSEINGIKIVRSGGLAGSGGDYCVKNRLTGKASQTVLVVNDEGIQGHYPVCLE